MNCSECGKKINKNDKSCPHCGNPISKYEYYLNEYRKSNKKNIIIILIIAAISSIVVLGATFAYFTSSKKIPSVKSNIKYAIKMTKNYNCESNERKLLYSDTDYNYYTIGYECYDVSVELEDGSTIDLETALNKKIVTAEDIAKMPFMSIEKTN